MAWIRSERLICVFIKTTNLLRIKLVHKTSLCNLRCRDVTTHFSFFQPKCGFLPFSRHISKECKRKVCRFCMHQHYKASTNWESNKEPVVTKVSHGLQKWSQISKSEILLQQKKKKRIVQCSVNILLSVCTVRYHTISPLGVWLQKMLRKYENQFHSKSRGGTETGEYHQATVPAVGVLDRNTSSKVYSKIPNIILLSYS